LWAPLPERTEGIFSESSSFLSHGGLGIQANYATFFNDLKKVSDLAFVKINKNVSTGFTANNFTEVASTWLLKSIFDTAGLIVIDHYGSSHTTGEMDTDIRKIYSMYGRQVFLQEWGDYWNSGLPDSQRIEYLNNMYAVFQKLVNDGILIGFNYWGAWDNNLEGILKTTGNNTYAINDRGLVLRNFFETNGSSGNGQGPIVTPPSVVPLPPPIPTPPPITPPTPVPSISPPTVALTAPAVNSSVSGTNVTISANASDSVGIVGVQFLLNGNNLGSEDTSAPFTVSWNTTIVSNGTYAITVRARNIVGNSTISVPRTVIVSNTNSNIPHPPSILPPPQSNPPEPVKTPPPPPPTTPTPLPPPNPTPQTPSVSLSPYKDGTLIINRGVVYTIEYGLKRPIASMEVFDGFGYEWKNVISADVSAITSGEGLFTANQRHARGSIVLDEGTAYFLGKDFRYPYPSAQVFLSWDNRFQDLVIANSEDRAIPIGAIAVAKNKVLGVSFTPLPFGTIIKTSDKTVYLVFGDGSVYEFSSEELFVTYGFAFENIKTITDEELSNYDIHILQQ
jgi:hypothetical protein